MMNTASWLEEHRHGSRLDVDAALVDLVGATDLGYQSVSFAVVVVEVRDDGR